MNPEFSEEDKRKIIETLEKIQNQYNGSDLNDLVGRDHTKLIECRHEILISVTAHVLEDDVEGQLVGSKEICKKNYHIPVPSNIDYHEYLKGFFDLLEGCMSSSAQTMNDSVNKPEVNNE